MAHEAHDEPSEPPLSLQVRTCPSRFVFNFVNHVRLRDFYPTITVAKKSAVSSSILSRAHHTWEGKRSSRPDCRHNGALLRRTLPVRRPASDLRHRRNTEDYPDRALDHP